MWGMVIPTWSEIPYSGYANPIDAGITTPFMGKNMFHVLTMAHTIDTLGKKMEKQRATIYL